MNKINANRFYREYHGHPHQELLKIIEFGRQQNSKIVYLAGDSSLDNKYWVKDVAEAINGYEQIIDPAIMKEDVCYHLNDCLQQDNYLVVNCAVEEATLDMKTNPKAGLSDQDRVVRHTITNNDILVVSIGGNDIALKPSLSTIFHMLMMTKLNSIEMIRNGPESAWGMNHFVKMFRDKVTEYIREIIGQTVPSKIIVCMIYYPDESDVNGGWANSVLKKLGYDSDPEFLQEIIQQLFYRATSKIEIPGTQIISCPLFAVLNGKDTNDYVARVEPSAQGGAKMAKLLANLITK